MMRVFRLSLLAVASAALLCGSLVYAQESSQDDDLLIVTQDYWFEPAWQTVPVGTTVRWTNEDVESHTVTEELGSFDAEIWPGEAFSFTFTAPGVYFYYCRPHDWMIGEITVVGSS